MSDLGNLSKRIDAEFTALDEKFKQRQAEQVQAHQQRQQRLEQFDRVMAELRQVWGPRLEALMKKFGDRVKVTPRLLPSTREATFEFQSDLAQIRLTFAAYADRDVSNVILASDLKIIPVLTKFDSHSEMEFPLDQPDREAIARWVEDRIVSFVRTYLSLSENELYLKDQMVEDPIARVRFPQFAAAATIEWQGQKYYFIGEETKREFEKKNAIAAK